MPELLTYIKPPLLALIPVLYGIAEIIKTTPVKHWKIPFILWGAAIVLCIIYLFIGGVTFENVFTGIIQGTFIATMTVGGNQFIVQATRKRKRDNTAAEPNE